MVIQLLLYLILAIVVIAIAIDLIPVWKSWFGRIHIGRYSDKRVWSRALTVRGLSWLSRMPAIKVTDNTRLIVLDMLRGNYTKSAIQHWQEAALLLGLNEYLRHNDDPAARQSIMKFLDSKLDGGGRWKEQPKHVDTAILAYAILSLDFIDSDRYEPAIHAIWELIREHLGGDGTVNYRQSMKGYRYVDTVGFICPFLVAYGLKYDQPECIDLAVKQIVEYEQYGMLESHHIPVHAYKVENRVPLGLYGWGRGLGWFAVGLIDAWSQLPPGHRHKPVLERSVETYARAVMRFQHPDGSWKWTVTRGECRPDSSAAATLSWFLLGASAIDRISAECRLSAETAMQYLMGVTRRSGAVDFSQGDTKDIGVYSMLFDVLPFTQGYAIRTINRYLNTFHKKGEPR
ncbi:glycoside hydrolase family 88 protein [Paenibacillus rhizophilus]|uniref:Uncharacterized protein n=1 Tax=Paenibacillus rhizophilus TaxID=1850366 RepID=A0A3N9P4E8_9BACL|nr:glycoside hydrolase family 88 protein [Paenibacillus rhizophilus]RQW10645.1 hypothetical protein EH198_15440 [Paenibacillus rhizophilus]